MTTAVNRSSARQGVRWGYVDIVLANFASGTTDYGVMELPAGAIVVDGFLSVTEVWNSTSSDVLDIGDAASENRYKNDANLQALGLTALVPTGYIYTAPTLLTVRWTSGGGTPTTGKAGLYVAYIQRGRSEFSQGLDYGSRLA